MLCVGLESMIGFLCWLLAGIAACVRIVERRWSVLAVWVWCLLVWNISSTVLHISISRLPSSHKKGDRANALRCLHLVVADFGSGGNLSTSRGRGCRRGGAGGDAALCSALGILCLGGAAR